MESDQPAAGQEAVTANNERASVTQSLRATLKYINDARADKTIVIRDQDKVSIHLLRLSLAFAVVFIVTPIIDKDLRHIVFASTILADLLFCAALVWFVLSRFGILRTMSKRHALICCQLMIGAGILVAVLALNFAAAILMFFVGPRLSLLLG